MAGKFGSLDTASPGIAFVITSSPLLTQNPAVPSGAYNWDMRILMLAGKGGIPGVGRGNLRKPLLFYKRLQLPNRSTLFVSASHGTS